MSANTFLSYNLPRLIKQGLDSHPPLYNEIWKANKALTLNKLSSLTMKQQIPLANLNLDSYCFVMNTEYGNRWLFSFSRTLVIAVISLNKNTYQYYSIVNPKYNKSYSGKIKFLFTCTACPKLIVLWVFYIEIKTYKCKCPMRPILLEKVQSRILPD